MASNDQRPGESVAAFLLSCAIGAGTACSSGPVKTECPDGTVVQGTECELAADGTYVGDAPGIPEDAADDTADRIDEEANEESGLVPVEIEVIEVDRN